MENVQSGEMQFLKYVTQKRYISETLGGWVVEVKNIKENQKVFFTNPEPFTLTVALRPSGVLLEVLGL